MWLPMPKSTNLPCLTTRRAVMDKSERMPAVSIASTSEKSMMMFKSPLAIRS